LRTLRERYEARRLRLYHAGDSVAGPDFTAAAIAGGMTHLSLVHTAAARQGTEMAALTGGNALALATVASSPLLRSPTGVTVAVSVPYIDADRSELVGRLAPLIQAGIKHLELHLPWDFKNPEVFELVKFARIFLAWKRLGGRSGELVYGSPAQSGTLLFRLPFEFFQMRCNAGNRFVQHFGSSSMADWIALSVPPALRRPKKHAGRNSEFILDGLPGKAITQSEIDVMRPG
jgi:hypothetical protein